MLRFSARPSSTSIQSWLFVMSCGLKGMLWMRSGSIQSTSTSTAGVSACARAAGSGNLCCSSSLSSQVAAMSALGAVESASGRCWQQGWMARGYAGAFLILDVFYIGSGHRCLSASPLPLVRWVLHESSNSVVTLRWWGVGRLSPRSSTLWPNTSTVRRSGFQQRSGLSVPVARFRVVIWPRLSMPGARRWIWRLWGRGRATGLHCR